MLSRHQQKTTISERQLTALYRVVCSMNLVGARISVAPDELLTSAEMRELEGRLFEAIREPFELAEAVQLSVRQDKDGRNAEVPNV